MLTFQKFFKNPQKIWEMLISIYILGLINLYFIHTYGLEGKFPFTPYFLEEDKWYINNNLLKSCGEILKINENNLLFLIFINVLFLLIFNSGFKSITLYGLNNIEFSSIVSFGLLGLNIIILSNDLIFIFIAIELYSLSVYLLILIRISKNTSRMSIIYLLINSLSSYTFLIGIALLYKYTGSISLEDIMYILKTTSIQANIIYFNGTNIGIILLFIGILLKLGIVPFNFWVLRLYTILADRILLYQIIIPKLVFVYLLYKILYYIYLFPYTPYNNNLYYFNILIFIISILSVIVSSIAGIFQTNFKAILTYSSILNMGFILLGLSQSNHHFHTPQVYENFGFGVCGWWEYLLIYTFNTFALFFCFLLINPSQIPKPLNPTSSHQDIITPPTPTFYGGVEKKKKNINIASNYPFLALFLLISIFSFIGIPPFGGFYAKLNIFINLAYSYNSLWLSSIIFLLISTFISACFYLKFVLYFFFPPQRNIYIIDNNPLLISNTPIFTTYLFSFFSIFLILYPFLSNYIYPFIYFF